MSDPSRFGPLARFLADVALVVDREGHLLEASPNAAAALGWSEPLEPDHWVIEVLHPDDQGRVIAHFAALEPGESRRTDARLRMPDGDWRWHELIVTNLIDDAAVDGLVVAAHDIATRKADELDLQRSEAYITSLVQHASDTILVLDAMVRIRYASPSVEALVGRKPNHLLGTNVLDLVHPEDLDVVADAFLEAAHMTGQTAFLDFRIVDTRGIERHVEAAATNLLDHPATNGIVVNVRDLAERDRAREVTERSERRFRKLIAHISDTITLVDAEGRVMMVTGAAREILGYPGEYWPGQNVFDIVHPEDQERVRAFHAAVLDLPGGEVTGQFRALHADGSWVDLEITVANLLDDPDVGGGVITSRNISSHKAIERALSDANKQALESLAAKAEFVAQVGHEVRTPIHGIIGLAELLGEARIDDESRRLVEAIRRSGEGLGMVINDLLDFSKMEAGRLELEDGVVSPHRVISDVVEMLRPQADERNIALLGSLDARVPVFVRGDEHRLRQVLVNLLGNAVKYTDRGSVTVTVETVKRMGEACLLHIAVTDTGVGIPADEIERLFDPFTQASTTAAMRRPGTGLGLTITRQIVELMGGEITVTSQVGKGSTFAFDLPTVATAPDEIPRSTAARGPEVLARGRVLVVEDSPVNQALVERQLVRLGCESVVASGGAEALGLMDELRFDLVLMDWQLPGIDGLETTRRWRAQEGETEDRLPIIAMTASAMPGARAECLAAGMDGFLPKPVKLDDLAAVLERYLAVRGDDVEATADERERLVDRRVLDTLADEVGDPAIAARVVTTFLGELDGRLAALRASTSQNDRETLQRTAHTLKSTSRALGADALAEVCADLELRATEEDVDPAPLVEAIMRTASGSAIALREHLRLLNAS